MFRKLTFTGILLLCFYFANAQSISKSPDLEKTIDSSLMAKIDKHLEALFLQIKEDRVDNQYIQKEKYELTKSMLKNLKEFETVKEEPQSKKTYKSLINLYPINEQEYSLKIAYLQEDQKTATTSLRMIFHLIAKIESTQIKFSIPLNHFTANWNSKKIGNVNYIYSASLNEKRAIAFNQKNTRIAAKLDQPVEAFDFYMCDNYQEILKLLGFEYDATEVAKTVYGYGVDANTIFSIENNEDFSHDVFHYYSGKINKRINRNWIAEEGIAYSWGNAYYVDPKGEMINQALLVAELRQYLQSHPTKELFQLFEDNTKIFNHLSPKISLRSTISSLLCDEIERRHGKQGIAKIINCGREPSSMENYMAAINQLLAINKDNFHAELTKLIANY